METKLQTETPPVEEEAQKQKLEPEMEGESYFRMVLRRFKKHKMAVIGLYVLAFFVLLAIIAPLLPLHHPYEVTDSFGAPPSSEHWLGTDQLGRDTFSRLIYAARVSLLVGIGSVAISAIIGTVLGLLSGYFGRWVDMLIMRMTDVFMSFPPILLALVIVSIVGPSLLNLILVIALVYWPGVARLIRGNVLSLKEVDFIKAAKVLGLKNRRILFSHVLPNAFAPVLVHSTFGVAAAILIEAALSFLGMGVQSPIASWGNMLKDAQSFTVLANEPWRWVPPGLCIMITVLSINFVGDGLRDAIDPKSHK